MSKSRCEDGKITYGSIRAEDVNKNKGLLKPYIMNDIQKKLDWLNENTDHDIIYMGAHGSMNYDMFIQTDKYMSDIDVKAICVPSFDDILKGKKMFSHTYIMEDNSHIDVKDIRLYIDLWKKSNPAFLEILFTEFNIVLNDKFKVILDMADEIAFANKDKLLSAIKGMQMEKFKALKHPYPNIVDEIERYGYSRKQLHHLLRLYVFGYDICCEGKTFKNALIPQYCCRKLCIDFKVDVHSIDKIDEMADLYTNKLKEIVDNYRSDNNITVNEECYKRLEDVVYEIMKNKCVDELRGKK